MLVPLILMYVSTSLMAQINVMENYNGDFEYGTFDHWRFVEVADSAAGSYAEIVDNSFDGDYAAQITWKSGASGIIDLVFDNWNTNVEVVAGNTYTLNAAIMAIEEPGLLLHITLGYFNSAGGVISESTSNWVLDDFYEIKEHTSTAPAGATNCWIAFRLYAENGGRWPAKTAITMIDNVELWESPPDEPSATLNLQEYEICLYPNPVPDRLYIETNSKIESIEVYNIHGHLVKKSVEGCNTIYMADLSAGLYIIRVNSALRSLVKTIIKQ